MVRTPVKLTFFEKMDKTTAKTDQADDIIIPPSFIRYMYFSGVSLSPSMPDDPDHLFFRPRFFRKRHIWPLLMAVITSILAVVMCLDYIAYNHDELESLEFFPLIALLNRLNLAVQVPLTFLYMFFRRKRIFRVIRETSRLFHEICVSPGETEIVRKASLIFGFGWIYFCLLILVCALVFGRMWEDLNHAENLQEKGSFLEHYGVPKGTVPKYAYFTILCFSYILGINCDLTAQLSCALLILVLARAFNQVVQIIKPLRYIKDGPEGQLTLLRQASLYTQKLRNLTHELNDAFGYLMLLNCVRDLMASVALVALFLETKGSQRKNESLEDMTRRIHEDENRAMLVYAYTVIGVITGIARVAGCLRCHRRVQHLCRVLQKIEAETPFPEVQEECERSLGRITDTTGAVSAAGFFYLSKEYVTSMIGIMITYVIVVYQTRDEKIDSYDYARLSHLENATQTILRAISEYSCP